MFRKPPLFTLLIGVEGMKVSLMMVLALFAHISLSGTAFADQHREIPGGASMADVLNLWGQPEEKVVKEVRDEVVWYYPDEGQVVFYKGTVRKWRYPLKYRMLSAENTKKENPTPEIDEAGANLVRDMAEAVRESSSSTSAGPQRLLDRKPPLIRNRSNSGGRGIPIGDDEDEDEEEEE